MTAMGRYLKALLLALLLGAFAASFSAEASDAGKPTVDPLLAEFIANTHAKRQALEAKSPAEWTDAELEDYFYNATFVPYYALIKHIDKYRQHPSSAEELLQWMGPDDWPGNPLNDWAPMELRYDDPAFHAGDLVVRLCPPEWSSRGMYGTTVQLTFDLCCFGPREDFVPQRELLVGPPFMPPPLPGTTFFVGAYWGPAVRPDQAQ